MASDLGLYIRNTLGDFGNNMVCAMLTDYFQYGWPTPYQPINVLRLKVNFRIFLMHMTNGVYNPPYLLFTFKVGGTNYKLVYSYTYVRGLKVRSF